MYCGLQFSWDQAELAHVCCCCLCALTSEITPSASGRACHLSICEGCSFCCQEFLCWPDSKLWLQTSEESETSAGRLREAEASSAALQTQLKQLQDSHEAQADQSSQTLEAPISQEDADGMLLPCAWYEPDQQMPVPATEVWEDRLERTCSE